MANVQCVYERALLAGLLIAFLAVIATAACGGGDVSSSGPARWVTHRDAAGVSIETPAAWSFNRDPVPALAFPPTLFAAGTSAVPTGGDCAPTAAINSLPAGGALIAITEYPGRVDQPYTFPPGPATFELGRPAGPFGCWGVRTHRIVFEDGGRYFQVHVVFGQDASNSLRGEVRRSLDSLEVDPLPVGEQRAAKCASGQWTACPEAAWVYEVINEAQVSHVGNRGEPRRVAPVAGSGAPNLVSSAAGSLLRFRESACGSSPPRRHMQAFVPRQRCPTARRLIG